MLLQDLVATSKGVAETSGRLRKIAQLAELLGRLAPEEIVIAVGFLVGLPRQGRLGIGWALLRDAEDGPEVSSPGLTIAEVDQVFDQIKDARGKGSPAERRRLVGQLLARSTSLERRFLQALLIGEIRQGALEGVLTEAIATAAALPAADVRRAAMLAGDLAAVARVALTEGVAGMAKYRLEVFRPILPMLADSAPDLATALASLGTALVEWKLDGARVQVHKQGETVRVFTRNLNDVTVAVPEVVAATRSMPNESLILDGEVIALDRAGRPHPFQTTMRRFGRKLDVAPLQADLPVTPFFFDLLHADGVDWLDRPLQERHDQLAAIVPEGFRAASLITADLEAARRFEATALAAGHEGLMVKALDARYAAGRRGSAWTKVKTARTLDLVVLAAEWGSGRRQGWLSNIHLGARDPATGGFVMLGKTFKGMTDEMLEWQTREFRERVIREEGHVVYLRPELVVEVAFNEVQASSQYPGGVTLRFARVKGYRPDKSPADADTIDTVRGFAPGMPPE